jgi:hypothetical protein
MERVVKRHHSRRVADIVMMVAAFAFALQATFVAMSEAVTGDSSHYYQGFVLKHLLGEQAVQSHVVTHMHANGTEHRHAIDDDDLDDHIKQSGMNMAVVVAVLPCPMNCGTATIVCCRLDFQPPSPLQVAEQDGPREPPRPPSIT